MNFLAHCYLSCSDEDLLIGNLLADFLKPREYELFSAGINRGIQLHRLIDEYTDVHESSIQLKEILRDKHGKYAPVVVDLVWDYYLSRNWHLYSGDTIEDFSAMVYQTIDSHIDSFPFRLQRRFKNMIHHDFLSAYNGLARSQSSLAWMDRRAAFASSFVDAIDDIQANDALINRMFMKFFPEIIEFVEKNCPC